MTINDSMLLQNFFVGLVFSLLLMLLVFLKTKAILNRIKETQEAKYRLENNIKQKKKKKNRTSLGRLILVNVLYVACLIFFMFKDSQYLMDYYIKDYQSDTGVVQNIKYKSKYRVGSSWIVKLQGRGEPFELSNEQKKIIKEGEVHTIIYAKRTGMILKVE